MSVSSERNEYEKRMLRVLQYIYENPNGDLSLDKLADVAAMSRFHWHRVFLALTGETCAQAVRRIRLHLSASMLCRSDLPVAEIAKNIGYPNSRSFIRVFSDRYGLSPGVFRKMGRIGPLVCFEKWVVLALWKITLLLEKLICMILKLWTRQGVD